jgi:hypothetical protein
MLLASCGSKPFWTVSENGGVHAATALGGRVRADFPGRPTLTSAGTVHAAELITSTDYLAIVCVPLEGASAQAATADPKRGLDVGMAQLRGRGMVIGQHAELGRNGLQFEARGPWADLGGKQTILVVKMVVAGTTGATCQAYAGTVGEVLSDAGQAFIASASIEDR